MPKGEFLDETRDVADTKGIALKSKAGRRQTAPFARNSFGEAESSRLLFAEAKKTIISASRIL